MDDSKRHAAGLAVRRRVLGNAHVDRVTTNAAEPTREFQDLLTRHVWGEIWTRPGLDVRVRRILTIGTLVALGRTEELRLHIRAALTEVDGRLSAEEIKEILLQQAVYCGIPAANTAFEVLRDALEPRKS